MDKVRKPSEWLDDLLMCRIKWDDAPEAIRSWARLPIHEAAVQILAEPNKAKRQKMLGRIPSGVRHRVQAETMRVWELRKGK